MEAGGVGRLYQNVLSLMAAQTTCPQQSVASQLIFKEISGCSRRCDGNVWVPKSRPLSSPARFPDIGLLDGVDGGSTRTAGRVGRKSCPGDILSSLALANDC